MQITSGSLKGIRIKTLKGFSTRPLLSRVRKSLFDILGQSIEGKKFLDLYAGSGAVGIEALSNGTREAVFVEKNIRCIQIIKDNLLRCDVLPQARVYQADVLQILPSLLESGRFPFIFVGPPYFKGLQDKTLDIIEKCTIHGAEIIVQHAPKEKVKFQRKNVHLMDQRRYGQTCLTFLVARF